jgi:hypothetical protein
MPLYADVSSGGSSDSPLSPFEYALQIDPEVVDPENYETYCQLLNRLSVQGVIPQDAYRCVFTLADTRVRVRVRLDDDNSLYLWFWESGSVYDHRVRPENLMTPEYYLGLVRGLLMVCS